MDELDHEENVENQEKLAQQDHQENKADHLQEGNVVKLDLLDQLAQQGLQVTVVSKAHGEKVVREVKMEAVAYQVHKENVVQMVHQDPLDLLVLVARQDKEESLGLSVLQVLMVSLDHLDNWDLQVQLAKGDKGESQVP